MVVDIGITKPTGKIVERTMRGTQPIRHSMEIETTTSCLPGRLVKKGTTDADAVVNTVNNNPIGWLGYEQNDAVTKANASGLNGSVDGTFAANDHVAVLNGGGFYIVASLKANEVATKGDGLYPAASGELATWVSGATPIATAMQSIAYSATSEDIVVSSRI